MKKFLIALAIVSFSPSIFADDQANKLALAREAIAAMQIDKMFDGMALQMKEMANQMTPPLPADTAPATREKINQFQSEVMELTIQETKAMIASVDAIYASVYSEAELKAMIAFFKSPEGQSMLAKQPQVMQQLMPLVQSMQQKLMQKIQPMAEQFDAEMKALRESAPPQPSAG